MKGCTKILVFAVGTLLATAHGADVKVRGWGESGFLSVIDHKVQFSENGTCFDYDDQGGQNVLFPFRRWSVDFAVGSHHTILFLYQPLAIETEVLLNNSIVVDNEVFPDGTPVRLVYSFPFYRLSYLYDFLTGPVNEFAVGLSLQIRNATIVFSSLDGERFRANRDVGPVPALKLRTTVALSEKWWAGIEADGIYAPVSYINGSDNEVTGAILDAVTRVGYSVLDPLDTYLAVRYLGGGAEGTSDDMVGPGDGFVKNWLHFLVVVLGVRYSF